MNLNHYQAKGMLLVGNILGFIGVFFLITNIGNEKIWIITLWLSAIYSGAAIAMQNEPHA